MAMSIRRIQDKTYIVAANQEVRSTIDMLNSDGCEDGSQGYAHKSVLSK